MQNRTCKKILIAVDLDNTQFISHKCEYDDIHWLGGKDFWLTLYGGLTQIAAKHGCELIFAVITAKDGYDFIAQEAAITLRSFLEKNNSNMYRAKNNNEWCLVDNYRSLAYLSLQDDIAPDTSDISEEAISHFHIHPWQPKSAALNKIAESHGIHPEFCIMLDDTPSVLDDVKNNGIHTVSFECFHPYSVDIKCMDDKEYIARNLKRITDDLLNKFQNIMSAPFKPRAMKVKTAIDQVKSTTENHNGFVKKIIPEWLLAKKGSWATDVKRYYTSGIPVKIKEMVQSYDSNKNPFEGVCSQCDSLSESDVINSLPSSGTIMLFDEFSAAYDYVHSTRLGNIYENNNCFQSAIFEVAPLDLTLLSKLQMGQITYHDDFNGLISTSSSKAFFVETKAENIKLVAAHLQVSSLAGVYKHSEINMESEKNREPKDIDDTDLSPRSKKPKL